MKVSIIIPLYNTEKYIASALESALQQTYEDTEILVVDDGSTDRGVEICRQFDNPKISIIQQENRGLSGARNAGIRNAKGRYIVFLDADDLWVPEKIEKHVKHLEANPDVGVSFSYSRFINENGDFLGIYQFSKVNNITPLDILCRTPIGNGSAAVFRKEVFEDIEFKAQCHQGVESQYFDEAFRETQDVECWMRIVLNTKWVVEGIPQALTLYRVNSNGISANLMKKAEAWERLIDKIYTYAPRYMAKWERRAIGYHMRHLARRAVTLKDKEQALKLFQKSITAYWPILIEEPFRTSLTGLAAVLLWLLPTSLYNTCFKLAVQITGPSQKRRFANNMNFSN